MGIDIRQIHKERFSISDELIRIFCPYRVCPLGAHVDHQLGLVTGFAIDKGIELLISPTDDGNIEAYSTNFSGKTEFNVEDVPERRHLWGDFLQGAVVALSNKYKMTVGFKGIVSGTLPVGGLSSSSSVIIAYLMALCIVNHIRLTQKDLISTAMWVEKNYIGVNVGKLDQSCEIFCKKDHLLFLDTKDDTCELLKTSSQMPPFEIAVIFSGIERKLAGSAYNRRVDECKAAAYALKAYAGIDDNDFQDSFLRNVPFGLYDEFKMYLPDNWASRAKHFFEENMRVQKGIKAWKKGNIDEFGELIFESGESSIYNYQTGSIHLQTLHEIMLKTTGIYGGRFSGAGFNGCAIALVEPGKKEEIAQFIRNEYVHMYPRLEHKFMIDFCKTSDGADLKLFA